MVRCSKLHRYNLIYLRIKKLKLAKENKHTYKSVNGSHAVEQASIWSDVSGLETLYRTTFIPFYFNYIIVASLNLNKTNLICGNGREFLFNTEN